MKINKSMKPGSISWWRGAVGNRLAEGGRRGRELRQYQTVFTLVARDGEGTNNKYDLDWRVRLAVRSDPPKGGVASVGRFRSVDSARG